MGRFTGKVAIVTGGADGIGGACCTRLAAEGASVAVLDINLEKAQALADRINATGGKAAAFACDVASQPGVAQAFAAAVARFGRLDVVVNNAGIGGSGDLLEDTPFEWWDRTIAINLSGVFYGMRAAYAPLAASGGGAIVNIASILGTVGFPEAAPYVAAKHGVVGLTRSAALSWGAEKIRVTAVCPTFVRTALTSNLPDDLWPALLAEHALGELPSPEDIAAMVLFLASDDARHVTGSTHVVDGGYTAR